MRIQNLSPLLQHSGVDLIVPLYQAATDKFYPDYTVNQNSDELYFRTAAEGDLPQASPINEARGITYQEYRTPFFHDWYPIKYGVGFATSTEAEETDYYNIIKKKSMKMVESVEWAIDVEMARLFNEATTFLGADGKALAADDHPLNQGGVATNIIPDNPALGYNALETAWQMLLKVPTDSGNFMRYVTDFILLVSTDQAAYAERLLETNGISGTFNLDPSTVKKRYMRCVASPYFTSPIAWMVIQGKQTMNNLMMITRRGKVARNQYDINIDANKYTLTQIFCPAFKDWRGIIYSDGSGS